MRGIPFTRSLINRSIAEAKAAFARFGSALPPFAFWSPEVESLRLPGWILRACEAITNYRCGVLP